MQSPCLVCVDSRKSLILAESSNASLLTNAEKIATITTTHTPQTIAQETK